MNTADDDEQRRDLADREIDQMRELADEAVAMARQLAPLLERLSGLLGERGPDEQ